MKQKTNNESSDTSVVSMETMVSVLSSDFCGVTPLAVTVLQIDVCSDMGPWHTRVHATWPGLRTKLQPWLAGDRYSVQGQEHALARAKVRLQSVKETYFADWKKFLESVFVMKEGARSNNMSIFGIYDLDLV